MHFFRQVGVALWLEPCRRFAVSELLATVFLPGCMVSVGCAGLPLPFAPSVSYTLSCQARWWDLSHHIPLITHQSSFCFIPCMSEVAALISFFYCISDLSIWFYLREPSAPSPSLAVPESKLWHWYIHLQRWHQPTKQRYCLVVSLRCILYPFL